MIHHPPKKSQGCINQDIFLRVVDRWKHIRIHNHFILLNTPNNLSPLFLFECSKKGLNRRNFWAKVALSRRLISRLTVALLGQFRVEKARGLKP